jgi:nucleoside phosphorylase
MNTLIVVPTRREAHALPGQHPAIAGAGPEAGRRLARRLARAKPELVLIAGLCGGLDPSMRAGGVILGRNVILPDRSQLDPDRFLVDEVRELLHRRAFPFVYSRLLTVEAPAATRDEKRDLWNAYGAAGVDMETYFLAEAAQEAGVRWLALRVVVDGSRSRLPASLATWDRDGAEGASLVRAWRRPAEWPAYLALARAYPKARRGLSQGVDAVVRAASEARVVETLPMVEVRQ